MKMFGWISFNLLLWLFSLNQLFFSQVQEKLQEEIAALTATLQSLIKSKAGMALDDTKNS